MIATDMPGTDCHGKNRIWPGVLHSDTLRPFAKCNTTTCRNVCAPCDRTRPLTNRCMLLTKAVCVCPATTNHLLPYYGHTVWHVWRIRCHSQSQRTGDITADVACATTAGSEELYCGHEAFRWLMLHRWRNHHSLCMAKHTLTNARDAQ